MPSSLPRPALVFVTDRRRAQASRRAIEHVVSEAVAGGVDIVQLREKDLDTGELVALGMRVRDAIGGRALLFINGDIDAALALRADGAHLPAGVPDIPSARARIGAGMWLSVAAHSLDEAQRASAGGADLVQLGTAYPSASHPGVAPLGVDGVRAVCVEIDVPVIAIGGITAANAGALISAGAAGVAVIGAILDAPDPGAAAAGLRRVIALEAPAR